MNRPQNKLASGTKLICMAKKEQWFSWLLPIYFNNNCLDFSNNKRVSSIVSQSLGVERGGGYIWQTGMGHLCFPAVVEDSSSLLAWPVGGQEESGMVPPSIPGGLQPNKPPLGLIGGLAPLKECAVFRPVCKIRHSSPLS